MSFGFMSPAWVAAYVSSHQGTVMPWGGSPPDCWAGKYPGDPKGCYRAATTDIGLCDEHYEEIVPHV